MLIPFVGIFISLTIWGTFFQVPGFNDPQESFTKRIFGAMEATAVAKGVYDLAGVIKSAYKNRVPQYQERTVVHPAGFESNVELMILLPNTTTQATAVSIETGFESNVELMILLPNTTTQATAVSIETPLRAKAVDDHVCGPSASVSMKFFGVTMLIYSGLLAAIWFRYKKNATASVACGRGTSRNKLNHSMNLFNSILVSSDQVPSSLYELIDALSKPNMPLTVTSDIRFFEQVLTQFETTDIFPLLAQETPQVISIHREVEKTISRIECQRVAASVYSQLWISFPVQESNDKLEDTQNETTNPVDTKSKSSPVALSSIYIPSRQWALVVRRPEHISPFLYIQMVCALLARLNETNAEDKTNQAVSEPGLCTEPSTPPSAGRRKRPSQAKRQRYARRRQNEEMAAAQSSATTVVNPGHDWPATPDPRGQGLNQPDNHGVAFDDARYGQQGGARPFPPPVILRPGPAQYGWQGAYKMPPYPQYF
ncbi:hypothetical protein FE257_012004 [Aspergillus nanangensis]|uniref:Uncharacterized protein n=1 Tax=Aspergillus nanangensis TaxID=2582783 RepID=A0AAD4CGK1_ASPNN|nr:hypothetical protein FE257_012004 [Aspergillus nanangensis]